MITFTKQFKRVSNSITICLCLIISLQSCKEKQQKENTEAEAEDVVVSPEFESIFDGKTLNGWDGDATYWSVVDGNLVGEITPETLLKTNTFIIYQDKHPADFELKLEFKISENGNSGINYRSDQLDTIPFALRGYQADIDGKIRYTGQNYEERKRATLAYRGEKAEIFTQDNADEKGSLRANVAKNCWQSREVLEQIGNIDSLKTKIKSDDWNEAHLIIKENRLQHYINGVLMSEVIDNDSINRMSAGKLGVQVHVGPPMKVEYRNIMLKEL
ncbi:DUF1080 domain-containing protein [Aurantibacter crassamenti]|uniref:3-keto-disaccharide hydrolase n=1 Tax=Aurantibacter crassamenti TaxID=1837375 RepID=UPI001939A7F1|nr:DUF1080 domain-containing protein [Aurantibacter crassamenti]MBM1105605.1 DUF1080 domain-containing protein [Aurantibacter crassamenti]